MQHLNTQCFELPFSYAVVFNPVRTIMDLAVDLDADSVFSNVKIKDVWTHAVLSLDADTQLVVSEPIPNQFF